ncbi:MAG: hypothetical protein D6705_04265 [Deltaproteobacteria bacterium]|nr:MAG: hypothetical protein D6705_04265 [Deltaproteobacteria bacterium]
MHRRLHASLALVCVQLACTTKADEGASSLGSSSDATTVTATATGTTGSGASSAATTGTGSSTTGGATGPKFDVAVDAGLPPPDETTCEAAAEARSSAGCRFAPVVANQNWTRTYGVAVGNVGTDDAHVVLYDRFGAVLEQATVPPASMEVFTLEGNSQVLSDHQSPIETAVHLQALRLESDVPVVAYQFTPYADSQVASSDASLLLPDHAWDDDYVAVNFANDGVPWILVVSLDDGNEVTVQAPTSFSGLTAPGAGIPALGAGQSFSVQLDAQQALRVITSSVDPSVDLTGFRVTSTAPVAVFVGSPSISIPGPGMNFYKDYLEEQLLPVAAWGTHYVAAKFRERGGETDLYRIVAAEDGTVVELSGDVQATYPLDAGAFVQVASSGGFEATANHPFLVAHFLTSQDQTVGPKDPVAYPGEGQSGNCQTGGANSTYLGDPAMSILVPTEQYRRRYVFLTPATYAWDSLTVVAPSGTIGDILLDGGPITATPVPVGGGPWSRASFAVGDGVHVIEGPAGFGIEAYGYDCAIAYAYPGGMRVEKINPAG